MPVQIQWLQRSTCSEIIKEMCVSTWGSHFHSATKWNLTEKKITSCSFQWVDIILFSCPSGSSAGSQFFIYLFYAYAHTRLRKESGEGGRNCQKVGGTGVLTGVADWVAVWQTRRSGRGSSAWAGWWKMVAYYSLYCFMWHLYAYFCRLVFGRASTQERRTPRVENNKGNRPAAQAGGQRLLRHTSPSNQ